MDIGFDAIRLFNNTTGLGNYSRYVLRALLQYQAQHRYSLYTPKHGEHGRDIEQHSAVSIRLPPAGLGNVVGRNLWRSLYLGRRLARDGIDVYHGLTHELPADIRKSGVPGVVTMHDLIYLRVPGDFKAVDRAIYHRKFRRSCRDADAVIALSEQTRRDLIEFYATEPEKIEVVYQGCDSRYYHSLAAGPLNAVRQRYDLPNQFVLQVGSIEPRKNAALSVQALAKTSRDLFLVIAGRRTGYQADVEHEIKRQGLADRVRILNGVPTEDLPALYQLALFTLFPSLFEGFGLPVLESLAGGTPVIAATGSCLEEAGGPGAIYVDPHNADELAAAMDLLADNDARRTELARSGRAHARTFKPEKMAASLDRIYNRLAGR